MGLGGSLVVIAIGAILRWAISATTSGVNIHTIGLILLIAGGVGLVISFLRVALHTDRNPRPPAYPNDPRGAGGNPQPRA